MSDFSDLCPLFNTGVYGEVTLPYMEIASISSTDEAGGYLFGRSVVVTDAYVIKHTTLTSTTDSFKMILVKSPTWASATRTIFASFQVSKTLATQAVDMPAAMTVTDTTFGATDVVMVTCDGLDSAAKSTSMIIRFKEK